MTSFGVDREIITPGLSPTFSVQGQVYHRIGSLFAANNEKQILTSIFLGDEDMEVNRRCEFIQFVEQDMVLKIHIV